MTEKVKTVNVGLPIPSDFSGNGHFYIAGNDAPIISALFEEWLRNLTKNFDVKINTFNYGYHFNGKGFEHLPPKKSLKDAKPNPGGMDSYPVKVGR